MAYQVLARKYRPKCFADVIGQAHVVQALTNALNKKSLHHAYLFTGTHGIGKTSLARIFAKCLNCETGITPTPCNQCNHCQEIDAGIFPDFYEIDAASRTKVEDTRDLLSDIQYAPNKGRYKVYLIDEVHMLSGHSFNALLKTLEEPPDHVKFLLATTEQQKLPATVLSRCLQFHLHRTSTEQAARQIQQILNKESIEFELPAIELIAKAAHGSMRDALSLLDQCIALCNGKLLTEATKMLLGTIEPTAIFAMIEALHSRNGEAILQQIDWLSEQGVDFKQALGDLLSILHRINVSQLIPQTAKNDEESQPIQTLAKLLRAEDVQLFYQIGIVGQRDFDQAPSARVGFEMTLLRMLAFYPENTEQTIASAAASKVMQNTKKEPNSWHKILNQLSLSGAALALGQNCTLEHFDENQAHLSITAQKKALLLPKSVQRINEALSQHFQRPITATIRIADQTNDTPAQIDKKTARQSLDTDPKIRRLMETFDATIEDNRTA